MKTKLGGFRMSSIMICVTATIGFVGPGVTASPPVLAGAAPAVLTCKSVARSGGVITLSGEIPGDYEIFDIKVKKGNVVSEIKSMNAIDRDLDPDLRAKLEEKGVIATDRVFTVVEDLTRGVFTMALRRGESYELRLYALPSTIRTRLTPNSKKAAFEAMLLEGEFGHGKPVRMRCTYDHSI